jgi:hypothetical protein
VSGSNKSDDDGGRVGESRSAFDRIDVKLRRLQWLVSFGVLLSALVLVFGD